MFIYKETDFPSGTNFGWQELRRIDWVGVTVGVLYVAVLAAAVIFTR